MEICSLTALQYNQFCGIQTTAKLEHEIMAKPLLLKFPVSRLSFATSLSLSFFSKSRAKTHVIGETWRTYASSSSKFKDIQHQEKGKKKRKRLDEVCLERYQQYSRNYIQSWILQGKVIVNGKVVNKAGTPVSDSATVEINAEIPKYVCRAGYKLEAAIEQLNVDVAGKLAMDSGLSTGGFTDCLLQYGASFVYGIDVGYGQVADKIRQDERVCVMERTNLRHLSGLPQKVDLVTLDLSFISILLVMPAVVKVMKNEAVLVTLVKPQFEARRSQVGSGGIVRDPLVHQEVLERIIKGVEEFGFLSEGWIESPLKGAEGNIEFLVCFQRTVKEEGMPPETTV